MTSFESTVAPVARPALRVLAGGRFLLGVTSIVAPKWFGRVVGIENEPTTTYMTRVYGARAIAMGLSYLTSPPAAQARWERLGLAIDLSDTAAGTVHVVRRDVPLRAALSMVALTGGYAVLGALSLRSASLRSRRPLSAS
jgi:hypothetical protein